MELDAIINQAQSQIDAAQDAATLDQVRFEFMGKKGKLTDLLKGLEKTHSFLLGRLCNKWVTYGVRGICLVSSTLSFSVIPFHRKFISTHFSSASSSRLAPISNST